MAKSKRKPESYEELQDPELVRRCLDKDEAAWRTLLERYSGLIYSIPLRQGLGRDLADEVFQSVTTTLVERLHLLEEPQCLPKWLMVTTARRSRLLQRKRQRGLALEQPAPQSEDLHAELERSELESHLAEALAQLGERDRKILEDLFIRELPYAEVARRHGLAIGSLGSLRARALARLRKLLERRGVV